MRNARGGRPGPSGAELTHLSAATFTWHVSCRSAVVEHKAETVVSGYQHVNLDAEDHNGRPREPGLLRITSTAA